MSPPITSGIKELRVIITGEIFVPPETSENDGAEAPPVKDRGGKPAMFFTFSLKPKPPPQQPQEHLPRLGYCSF